MTFYEAAVQILQREGRPLHAREIAEIAVREALLSHVGKTPELTMASRLAAMARRSHDRRLVAVDVDTFGLADWNVPADEVALERSGQPEASQDGEPQLRSRERHPRVSRDSVRVAGRGDRRRKFEEAVQRKKKKRLAPTAAVVSDILERVGAPCPAFELAASLREHELVTEDLGKDALQDLLRSENERREGEGKRAVFAFPGGGLIGLLAWGEEPPSAPGDLPGAIAEAAARVAEERRARAAMEAAAPERPSPRAAAAPVSQAVAEQRQRTVARLRRRLQDVDAAVLESLASDLLAAMGYRDVKVARRGREGALLSARRRMGLCEVRFAVRVQRGREVRREDVLELRRDMGGLSAQLGVIVSPSEPTREARSEVSVASAPLVTLLCAEALADQMVERGVGVVTRTVVWVDLDEAAVGGAGREAPREGREGREGREERRERRDRERREWRERRDRERAERRARREAEGAAEPRAPDRAPAAAADAGGAPPEIGAPAEIAPADTALPGGSPAPSGGDAPT